MADTVEKIYCTENGNNDLAAILAATKNNDPATMMAAMGGGMNNWMNNPFVYLVWMMFANRMWGGEQNGNPAIQTQLDSLRNQMADNQNSNLLMDAVHGNTASIGQLASNLNCDFNTLNGAICDVRQGVALLAGKTDSNAEKIINAANLGDLNIVQQLKDCCCQTQQNIIKMGYENQLGQKDLQNAMQQGFSYTNTGLERGFSNIGFQMSQMACDLKTNQNADTQRIIDTLNQHWQADLQQRYNDARLELSQQRQNAELIAALKTTTTT
jgi:hypothetical protein